MPFARLTATGPDLPAQTRAALAADITALLEKDLFKAPEVTVVQINTVPASHWFVAGAGIKNATGVHLEVDITAGTNTAAEQATFIEHAYAVLNQHLGLLTTATYVVLRELGGESWGFNGMTQMARRRDPFQKS
ncbi:tautomerase family protein [Nocardia sp. AB354]|uniref:tautomerase family protein n=1 Tax=Nocardia sp. AB354 TaxID=3413283 RepID=UPI003C13BA59